MCDIIDFNASAQNIRPRRHVFVFAGVKTLDCGYSLLLAQLEPLQTQKNVGFLVENKVFNDIKDTIKPGDTVRFILAVDEDSGSGNRVNAYPQYFKVIKNLEIVQKSPVTKMWLRLKMPD